jgi:eukaryotic-like serine/threonine-protein kinase
VAGAIASGERLKDRYRLQHALGRGGMAAVWLGHDEVLDRPVAVKVLSDTISSDPGFKARFRREALMAAGLSHPNLVGVYDFSDQGERPYLVMEFVPGEDLASLLRRGEPLDCDPLARELLDAVAHIHGAGILHRDIKPANIIVEPSGTAKLIDFGIALPRDATALTRTGLVLGTERYAAPEVLEGRGATERSDLYSCGVVLQSCKGRRSRALAALVGAMTSRDPRGRPLSAVDALGELERPDTPVEQPTAAFEPTDIRPAGRLRRTGPAPGPYADPERRGNRRRIIAAVLAVLAAATIALLALSGGENPGGGTDNRAAGGGPAAGRTEGEAAEPGRSGSPSETTARAKTPPADSSGTDPGRGALLNEQGFALIQADEYEAAVPVLEEAVSSFPEGTEDLNYAYALFNLGNALRLSGRPDEAIPVLERRLEIPNQESEVRQELEAAYAEAGTLTPSKEG